MSAIMQWRFVLFALELGRMADDEIEGWIADAVHPLSQRMALAELARRRGLS